MSAPDLPEIATERLLLRPPRMEDFEGFAAFIGSDRARFVGGPIADRGTAWRAFAHMAGLWQLRGFGPFVWTLRGAADAAIGHGGAWQPENLPAPELGWCLWTARAEGHGYAGEAMQAALGWARTRGLSGLWAGIEPGNEASMRLAEALGGVRQAEDMTPDGTAIPTWHWPDPEEAEPW